jgi:hypothetical protein
MPVRMALVVIVVEVLLAGAARADHLWWMQPYRPHDGGSCCGEVTCVPATVVAGPDGQVIVNGVPLRLPPGSVHPVPGGVDTA